MRTTPPTTRALFLCTLLLFLLAACGQQQAPIYHTGSDGITLTFTPGMPPQTVYEDSVVPLVIQLANKGASDVNYSDIVFNMKGDPFYVNITPDSTYSFANANTDSTQQQSPGPTVLHGKQDGWPNGEYINVQPVAMFNPIPGLREQPSTQLFASICYKYATVLGISLCVDANAFNGNVQKQTCNATTLTFQNQGAPVAITSIENRPSPILVPGSGGAPSRDLVQPIFILHIANVGPGSVLMASVNNTQQLITACSQGVTRHPSVMVNATLSNLQLQCQPNPVPLQENTGYTTCTLPASASGTLAAPNYLAAFRAELDYVYSDSTSTNVEIQRAAGGVHPGSYAGSNTNSDPSIINGVTRCEYCSGNKNDPSCSDWPSDANQTASFSCACGEQDCLTRIQTDKGRGAPLTCVYGAAWCPGTNFCCVPGAS